MKAWSWFTGLFDKRGRLSLDTYIGPLTGEIFYKELAINACINLIAGTLSRAEWQTFEKGEEVRQDNYYLFNIEPNQNKSSSKFWRDVVSRLVYDNECLVIQENGMFYVADSFSISSFAFKNNIYHDVVIDGYQLDKSFYEPDVFHFELHDQKIKSVIDGLYDSYSKLIEVSRDDYKKSKTRRAFLKIGSPYPKTDEAEEDLRDLLSNRFKDFFKADGDVILPLTEGLEYEEPGKETSSSRDSGEGRSIRAFVDDVFDFVAMGFQIPPQLIKGGVTNLDKAWDSFLTVPINSLAKVLTDEINRKFYGKKAYLERTYVKLDTTKIKAVNIKDVANALDILTRIGAYSVDDSLKTLGIEPLNTEWSKVRWMTKNYESIETAAKGGE